MLKVIGALMCQVMGLPEPLCASTNVEVLQCSKNMNVTQN